MLSYLKHGARKVRGVEVGGWEVELECLLIKKNEQIKNQERQILVEVTETFQKSTDYEVGFLLCSIAWRSHKRLNWSGRTDVFLVFLIVFNKDTVIGRTSEENVHMFTSFMTQFGI